MRCINCRFENPAGMKFCGQCGTGLGLICPNCAFENPANFKFCGNCGASLADLHQSDVGGKSPSAPENEPADDKRREPEAERRQLTVMFCDLVGSTALSQQLDPEELHQVVGAYQAACVAVVNRFDGHVAQYLGDGLLIYFGYPTAHEDEAQRALQTGLGIIEAIERLNTRLEQDMALRLKLRIGIHTGLVVVGQIGSGERSEQLALGDTPNIAARLQHLAAPNQIIISASTYRLIYNFFATKALGAQTLVGIAEPLNVYQVLHEYALQNRLEAAAAMGLTPLVGREQELALLLARWEQVKEGAGQVVSLNGEAGIGKSRLLYSLKARLRSEPHRWLTCQASPYHQNSALYPLTELLQQLLDVDDNDPTQEKRQKIEAAVSRNPSGYGHSTNLTEAVPLLADLLGAPPGDENAQLTLPPQRQKQLTLEVLLAILLNYTSEQPVLFVVEDLHWIDPSTLEFINLLIDQASLARILVIFTFRPDFSPAWAARSHLTQLTLGRLTQNQVEQMIGQVTGALALPAVLRQQVAVKTDGVPLFVEELTKMVLEVNEAQDSEARQVGPSSTLNLAVPMTLQDSLMARLDRLASGKDVAQLAACLSREFSYDLLKFVADLDEAALRRSLAELVEAEVLYQRGLPPAAAYLFKHALIQEAAYRTLLRRVRQQYHLKIAHILEEHFPETADTQPELLAHHYTRAGLTEQAVHYRQCAGQRALERSANLEAIEHLTTGLNLIKTLPDSPKRREQQLTLQLALGVPYLMTKGYAAAEVEQVYAQAWHLCQQIDEAPQRASALFGLWVFYLVRADHRMARKLGDQLMAVAQEQRQAAVLIEAHQAQGINRFYLGELEAARHHLGQAMALYTPQQQGIQLFYTGANAGVACLSHAALTLWLLGYPDQAIKKIEEALALAKTLAHPYSQVFALSFRAWLHQYRREGDLAEQQAKAAIAAAADQAFELLLPFNTVFRGWGLVAQGRAEAGITLLQQGVDTYLATGAELGRLHFWALLAEAYSRVSQIEAGLKLLAEAIAVAAKAGERFYEAELYRLNGELLLNAKGKKQDEELSPEACFLKAIEVARRQKAKSLELRAVISLSRLWLKQGKGKAAKGLLTTIYDWFTEGHNTADLKDARALLEQLPS